MPKIILTIAGLGAVASVSLPNGSSYTLNQNTALVLGSLYEFAIHLPEGNTGVTVTGANLLWTETAPVED